MHGLIRRNIPVLSELPVLGDSLYADLRYDLVGLGNFAVVLVFAIPDTLWLTAPGLWGTPASRRCGRD